MLVLVLLGLARLGAGVPVENAVAARRLFTSDDGQEASSDGLGSASDDGVASSSASATASSVGAYAARYRRGPPFILATQTPNIRAIREVQYVRV